VVWDREGTILIGREGKKPAHERGSMTAGKRRLASTAQAQEKTEGRKENRRDGSGQGAGIPFTDLGKKRFASESRAKPREIAAQPFLGGSNNRRSAGPQSDRQSFERTY